MALRTSGPHNSSSQTDGVSPGVETPRVGAVTRVAQTHPATTAAASRAAVSALEPDVVCPTCGRGNPSKRSLGRTLLALFMIGIGGLWLLNPGAGFAFEILDNIPILGNIDEGIATMFLIAGLRYFGLEIPFLRPRR